jgi:hypothetical protein
VLAYLLVSQLIVAAAPTPEQSAQILAQLDSPSNFSKRFVCTDCDGPYVDILPSRAGDGPFGPFPQYYFPPLGYSFYYGGFYGARPWWNQGVYVSSIAPVVTHRGAWRGGPAFSAGWGPVPSGGRPTIGGPAANRRPRSE